ncbi:MAG: acylphosphatase [Anaerolineae bacterium]|nr:acylphosphatase [Anaerolineae bacterium]
MEDRLQASHARLHARVAGRVQGVNFRYYTARTAQSLGLTGWVANRPDNTVEVVAEGPQEALEELLAFLHHGPPSAYVTDVTPEWLGASGTFADFRVRHL